MKKQVEQYITSKKIQNSFIYTKISEITIGETVLSPQLQSGDQNCLTFKNYDNKLYIIPPTSLEKFIYDQIIKKSQNEMPQFNYIHDFFITITNKSYIAIFALFDRLYCGYFSPPLDWTCQFYLFIPANEITLQSNREYGVSDQEKYEKVRKQIWNSLKQNPKESYSTYKEIMENKSKDQFTFLHKKQQTQYVLSPLLYKYNGLSEYSKILTTMINSSYSRINQKQQNNITENEINWLMLRESYGEYYFYCGIYKFQIMMGFTHINDNKTFVFINFSDLENLGFVYKDNSTGFTKLYGNTLDESLKDYISFFENIQNS
jgi:hypothetical protein